MLFIGYDLLEFLMAQNSVMPLLVLSPTIIPFLSRAKTSKEAWTTTILPSTWGHVWRPPASSDDPRSHRHSLRRPTSSDGSILVCMQKRIDHACNRVVCEYQNYQAKRRYLTTKVFALRLFNLSKKGDCDYLSNYSSNDIN